MINTTPKVKQAVGITITPARRPAETVNACIVRF